MQTETTVQNTTTDDPLRGYIEALFRHWWLIAAAAVLAALAAGVVSVFLMTPAYEARAGVVISRSKIDVTLESQMRTLSESDVALMRTSSYREQEYRRETFAGLVKNGEVAGEVLAQVGELLEEEQRTPARLLNMVEVDYNQQSDLIQIVVTADDPELAAQIANAWADAYENHVNNVYTGILPASYQSVENETEQRKTEYEAAQKELTDYIAENDRSAELQRFIEEKQLIITELQSGKQAAIAAVIEEEIDIRRQIISAYLSALADNRLLGFTKGQEAKRQVLGELIDAEIANRLAALRRDRNIRLELFNNFVSAELRSQLAVFNQQVDEKLSDLGQAYSRRDKLDRLLRDATSLRDQIATAGPSDSNALALTLLKAEVFAASAGLPGSLQIQLETVVEDNQLADVEALIASLEQERGQNDSDIASLSESLLEGEGYQYLDQLSAENLMVSMPYTSTMSTLEALTAQEVMTDSLTAYINQRYADLFDLGEMARTVEEIIGDTPLFAEFEMLYPELFEPDAMMALAESITSTTTLREQAQQRAGELLQLDGMETILEFGAESEPLAQKIADLQAEVRALRAEQETINGEIQELRRARDLAWETYTTLARKREELQISQQAGGAEVQVASPAVVPAAPVSPNTLQNVALAGVVGLMLGVFVTFALQYLYPEFSSWAWVRGLWRRDG